MATNVTCQWNESSFWHPLNKTIDAPLEWLHVYNESILQMYENKYGSGHETVAVLSPGFAINW